MIERNISIGLLKIIRKSIKVVIVLLISSLLLLVINTLSSKYWPTTDGILDNLSLKKEYYKGKYSNYISLSYSYNVKNKDYISKRFNLGFISGNDYDVVSDYIKQQKILKVYYNPIVHSISVLKPGYVGFSLLPFILLLFPLVIYEQINNTIKNLENRSVKDEAKTS